VRAGRLISLVSILSREGRTTAASLAERLEVSERTILRDLEVLSGSGVPVYTTRGVGGGIQLLEGYTPTLPGHAWVRPASPRAATARMTVLITEEGRRTAAILGYLQPLRVRPEPARRDGWVTASCRLRSQEAMALEVLALGPHVEVVAPDGLREQVADLARRTALLYES
jgi:predicted DNA-binding transcriptional regulator YafY